ncbi:hypothetical protein PR048_025886 [Dryococelus australis]|uniref:Uncharacterized protein n=1 Tax=Dryococelus australis TaxID=614101 RepID=A0ABQ9GJU8_9NEOP|nr:hypothetical protein PR048_025886 [Dryococelus australis]
MHTICRVECLAFSFTCLGRAKYTTFKISTNYFEAMLKFYLQDIPPPRANKDNRLVLEVVWAGACKQSPPRELFTGRQAGRVICLRASDSPTQLTQLTAILQRILPPLIKFVTPLGVGDVACFCETPRPRRPDLFIRSSCCELPACMTAMCKLACKLASTTSLSEAGWGGGGEDTTGQIPCRHTEIAFSETTPDLHAAHLLSHFLPPPPAYTRPAASLFPLSSHFFNQTFQKKKLDPMRVIEVSMEQRTNEGEGVTGDIRENPLTSGIVRQGIELGLLALRWQTLHAMRVGAMRRWKCVLLSPVSLPRLLTLDTQLHNPLNIYSTQMKKKKGKEIIKVITNGYLTIFIRRKDMELLSIYRYNFTGFTICSGTAGRRTTRCGASVATPTGGSAGQARIDRRTRACYSEEALLAHDTGIRSGTGMKGWGERGIPEKTRPPTASSGTIPTCENPVTRFALVGGERANRSASVAPKGIGNYALRSAHLTMNSLQSGVSGPVVCNIALDTTCRTALMQGTSSENVESSMKQGESGFYQVLQRRQINILIADNRVGHNADQHTDRRQQGRPQRRQINILIADNRVGHNANQHTDRRQQGRPQRRQINILIADNRANQHTDRRQQGRPQRRQINILIADNRVGHNADQHTDRRQQGRPQRRQINILIADNRVGHNANQHTDRRQQGRPQRRQINILIADNRVGHNRGEGNWLSCLPYVPHLPYKLMCPRTSNIHYIRKDIFISKNCVESRGVQHAQNKAVQSCVQDKLHMSQANCVWSLGIESPAPGRTRTLIAPLPLLQTELAPPRRHVTRAERDLGRDLDTKNCLGGWRHVAGSSPANAIVLTHVYSSVSPVRDTAPAFTPAQTEANEFRRTEHSHGCKRNAIAREQAPFVSVPSHPLPSGRRVVYPLNHRGTSVVDLSANHRRICEFAHVRGSRLVYTGDEQLRTEQERMQTCAREWFDPTPKDKKRGSDMGDINTARLAPHRSRLVFAESWRTTPLVGGFSRGSPDSPAPFTPALLHSHLTSPSYALNEPSKSLHFRKYEGRRIALFGQILVEKEELEQGHRTVGGNREWSIGTNCREVWRQLRVVETSRAAQVEVTVGGRSYARRQWRQLWVVETSRAAQVEVTVGGRSYARRQWRQLWVVETSRAAQVEVTVGGRSYARRQWRQLWVVETSRAAQVEVTVGGRSYARRQWRQLWVVETSRAAQVEVTHNIETSRAAQVEVTVGGRSYARRQWRQLWVVETSRAAQVEVTVGGRSYARRQWRQLWVVETSRAAQVEVTHNSRREELCKAAMATVVGSRD